MNLAVKNADREVVWSKEFPGPVRSRGEVGTQSRKIYGNWLFTQTSSLSSWKQRRRRRDWGKEGQAANGNFASSEFDIAPVGPVD
jgi:hypothetical protein